MGAVTGISWCDHTFNPWIGCTKVSPACDNCYAELVDKRFGGDHWGPHAPRRRTSIQNWNLVRRWNKKAGADGVRRRVFCASLADVFDKAVDPAWRDDLWALIKECTALDFLLLTKRPGNVPKMLPADWGNGWPNVWLGTSVENQEEADRRIPALLGVPVAVRFLSCEPLLGPLRINSIFEGMDIIKPLAGVTWYPTPSDWLTQGITARHSSKIHWVIVGGESGPGARPMHPDWARSVRDQCEAAGVPFFFKQWGEWGTAAVNMSTGQPVFRQFDSFQHWVNKASTWIRGGICLDSNGLELKNGGDMARARDNGRFPVTIMHKVGKRASGDLLDGVQHQVWPTTSAEAVQ